MKYLITLHNLDGRPVETLQFANDVGAARVAFADSRFHPFSTESRLLAVFETGASVTLAREFH